MMPPAIRALGAFDLQLLAKMHKICFTAPWDQPWSAASFAEVLAMPGAAGWLISHDEHPLGFIVTRSVLDEMEILLVAIDPAQRGRGYGGLLLDTAIAAATRAGITSLFLEQAAPNVAARALYSSRQFHEVGLRRGYYHGPAGDVADALVLRLGLSRCRSDQPAMEKR